MNRRLFLGLLTLAACLPLTGRAGGDVVLDGPLTQGGLVIGKTEPGARVWIDGKPVRVSPEGRFLLGFDRDAPANATVEIAPRSGEPERRVLAIAPRKWDIQRIDGLPEKQVTPDPAAMARIKADNALLKRTRAIDTPAAYFVSGFVRPVTGRISGIYGSQRILNGEPRSPHRGLDIAAAAGTPVAACADGVVAMAEDDLFFTGKTVIVDHGHGLKSLYAHMSAITVNVGQPVAKGEIIGQVGATGRVTGPHLHWGVSLFDTYVDPELLAPPG